MPSLKKQLLIVLTFSLFLSLGLFLLMALGTPLGISAWPLMPGLVFSLSYSFNGGSGPAALSMLVGINAAVYAAVILVILGLYRLIRWVFPK